MDENPYKPPLSGFAVVQQNSEQPSRQLARLDVADWLGALSFGLIAFIMVATSLNVILMLLVGIGFSYLSPDVEMETLIILVLTFALLISCVAAVMATRWQNRRRLNALRQFAESGASVESGHSKLPSAISVEEDSDEQH